VPGEHLSLDQAVGLTRTGDVWLFRGRTSADRTIRVATNSPVNHVGMSVVIEDLPALMWHAELGRSLPDLWSGTHQRGAQPHDLNRAVGVWATKYHQQVWLRQLDYPITGEMDDARGVPHRTCGRRRRRPTARARTRKPPAVGPQPAPQRPERPAPATRPHPDAAGPDRRLHTQPSQHRDRDC
jgi:hypothetical protein